MKKLYARIVTLLSKDTFFWLVWVWSIIQALWIAVSARYPMAFDEAYHYNLIKLHTRQWWPVFLEQPPGPATYGALTRDPSYLQHYILSFPYRLLHSLGVSEVMTIFTLRLLNVAMFALGLYLFWRLLRKTKASLAAVNSAVLFYIMIPTVPLLAAHINYDNLQFPMLAAAMLMAIKATEELGKNKLHFLSIIGAICMSLLGSINKFTFLPVLTAITIYLVVILGRYYLRNKKRFSTQVKSEWHSISLFKRGLLALVIAVSVSLFTWTYGINIVAYHNPTAQCHQVLNPERCQTYGPWARNYRLAQEKAAGLVTFKPKPLQFMVDWIGGMHYRLFFVINGATGKELYSNSTAPVITGAAGLLALSGLVLLLRYGKRIVRGDQALLLMLFVTAVYVASLIGRNFNDYLHLGQMVAINGRYLIPLLPPVILLLIAAYQHAFRLMPEVKVTILLLAFICFLSGGGISGFIHYSNVNWYFENRPRVLWLNDLGKKIVAPLFFWRA